ncbi:MAG: DUF1731 domain-containing protein, partial [Flavobacteriales bacterium]|nr:DUF1731 domain-containing protein [Flavobacteriales bacterium]
IYPSTIDQANDEDVKETGESFKSKLSIAWEAAVDEFNFARTRKVIARITPVLSNEDGFWPPVRTIARLGLGGPQGSGKQMVSWVHHLDLCRAFEHIIQKESLVGPINIAAPSPLENKTFMKKVRKAVGMPIGLPAPSFAIRLGSIFTGVDPSLILDSSHVIPSRLLKSGFDFTYAELDSALEDLI